MAFTIKVDAPAGGPVAAEKDRRVFPNAKAALLGKIDTSIADAKERYIDENAASPENEVRGKKQGFASALWKPLVHKETVEEGEGENYRAYQVERPDLDKEIAKAGLKVGNSYWKILTPNDGKGPVKQVRLHGKTELIPTLEAWKEMVQSFEPDNEGGKAFHEVAIKALKPRTTPAEGKEWEYQAATDTYEQV